MHSFQCLEMSSPEKTDELTPDGYESLFDGRETERVANLIIGAPGPDTLRQGCQMAKFDPFLSLDCARVEGVGAQSKERKGSNFAA